MGTTEDSWSKHRRVSVGTFTPTPKMVEVIGDVLDSGQISYGKYSKMFEQMFAAVHGCKYAILSNSGTSALQIALQALKEIHLWENGEQVILPATTFVATANIIRHNNMRPVFVDVDPLTYNIDVSKIEQAITDETRCIIPVHLFGQPADVHRIKELLARINREDILIIEDSCESMFVRHHGQMVGSLGDIGCFSTYVAHLLVTGVGGISTTNDERYAAKMRSLVNHGLQIEFLNPDENFSPRPTPGRRFKFDTYGHSYRITEFEAALGVAQLQDGYDEMLRIRRRNANHLTARLKQVNRYTEYMLRLPTTKEYNEHAFMMYPIVIGSPEDEPHYDKEPLMMFLNEHGIETRDMLPILSHPIYSWLSEASLPISAWILRSGFYVGCHQDLTSMDMDYIGDKIMEWFSVQ